MQIMQHLQLICITKQALLNYSTQEQFVFVVFFTDQEQTMREKGSSFTYATDLKIKLQIMQFTNLTLQNFLFKKNILLQSLHCSMIIQLFTVSLSHPLSLDIHTLKKEKEREPIQVSIQKFYYIDWHMSVELK